MTPYKVVSTISRALNHADLWGWRIPLIRIPENQFRKLAAGGGWTHPGVRCEISDEGLSWVHDEKITRVEPIDDRCSDSES